MTSDNKYLVLIVDDSPEDRAAFRRFISHDRTRSYVFEEHDLGDDALERLTRTDLPVPDCLLLDYNLPDTSGIEFLDALKPVMAATKPFQAPINGEAHLPCAVVMLTGSGDEAAAVAAMKAGVQDYLVKGKLSPETLQQAIRNSIERFDLSRRLHDSEARLRLATEAAGIGTWTFHPQTRTVSGDPRYRELLGLPTSGPLDSEAYLNRVYDGDRDRVANAIRSAMIPGNSGRYNIEFRTAPYPQEPYRWIQSLGQATFDSSGERVEHFAGATLDITWRKQMEEERERYAAQQGHIAETLQRSLLISPQPGEFPGVDVYIEYRVALEEAMIGGDFADVFALDNGRIVLVAGDVTGKGLAAATYTAEIKFALRAFLRDSGDLSDAIGRLNRFLVAGQRLDTNPHWQLVALAIAVIDTAAGTVEACCAGAEAPLAVRSGCEGGAWTAGSLESIGPLLGLDEGSRFPTATGCLAPGDLLFIVTDGVTEARAGRRGDFFGYEGFTQAAVNAASLPVLGQVAKSIVSAARDFAGGRQSDDVCLLAVRMASDPVAAP